MEVEKGSCRKILCKIIAKTLIIMIVKFLCLADDKVFYNSLLAQCLLHGYTIRREGIFGEVECPDWKSFSACVWSAFAEMSKTSWGRFIHKRRVANVELPDYDDDVKVWYEIDKAHTKIMYGRA